MDFNKKRIWRKIIRQKAIKVKNRLIFIRVLAVRVADVGPKLAVRSNGVRNRTPQFWAFMANSPQFPVRFPSREMERDWGDLFVTESNYYV